MTPKLYKDEEALIANTSTRANTKKNRILANYRVNMECLAKNYPVDQEKALILWIEYLDNIGAPPTNEQIEESANYLLAKDFTDPGEPPRAGKMWIYNFLNRLPEKYVRIVQKPQERDWTTAEHYNEIERWFIDLKIAIQELKIVPQNLWNFDETGFIVGKGKDEAVVTAYPKDSKGVSSLSSRESITVVEAINAEGKIIPPLLIPKGENHMEEWYRHIQDDEWLIAPAKNGFITDEIAFEWLQHFQHYSKPDWSSEWRLLLMDSHTTHLTIQFVQYCEIYHIRPFRFPPHSTHFLQSLDGVPFQQYKHVHGRVVNKVARLDASYGDTLKIYGEPDDTIPSSPTTKSISPPSSVAKLRRYINKIEKLVDGIKDILDSASPGLSRRIKVINQGSLTLAELGELHRESFIKVRDTAKRKQQKNTKRQVKVMGALYVKDANCLIKRRHEGDLLRIHKSHILGVEEPEQQEAPTEPENLGYFIDTQGNR
ncbi:conserved hypothetical protein [Talaromyces stipitatus ATCC 10500]|uniref:HTH CENPB-type domain-containing protein n=1 Tax=Talaromyces stipitatus (strain ATCC 10500 / CBS 375.48 / QM 6759 / NRRL 1006) TaxID=441959 RepID=B8MRU7_TALSN|nr:uncharacterized protein TSTA_057700 [Talaromyces stipitatus ATCC 10500]EED13281.1 conserved hypothetical protein [Talaromyces stipitatus ATCC 10500]